MSGRGRGRARGNSSRGNSNRRTTKSTSKSTSVSSFKGLTAALAHHTFDYGTKDCSDKLRTNWEKLYLHVGTAMGPDISTKLSTGKKLVLKAPEPDEESKLAHADSELRRKRKLQRSITAMEQTIAHLQTLTIADDAALPTKLADAQNELDDLQEEMLLDKPVEMHGEKKSRYDSEWKTYRERKKTLELHRGQAFNMILGQCTPTLKEQMKADSSYSKVMVDRDPLALKLMMERTIYSRQETQYPYETLFEQTLSIYGSQQHALLDDQFYERLKPRLMLPNP